MPGLVALSQRRRHARVPFFFLLLPVPCPRWRGATRLLLFFLQSLGVVFFLIFFFYFVFVILTIKKRPEEPDTRGRWAA